MQRATSMKVRVLSKPFTTVKPISYRLLSTTPRYGGMFTKDRDDTLDPSKEDTASIGQAKDQGGANPAAQSAKVAKDDGPYTPKGGNSGESEGGDCESSGLGSKKKGEKPGEESVNPAVNKTQ